MSSSSRRSGACMRCCLVLFAVASALCVSAPALYWRFNKALASSRSSCPPCVCDCPPPLSLHNIAPAMVKQFGWPASLQETSAPVLLEITGGPGILVHYLLYYRWWRWW